MTAHAAATITMYQSRLRCPQCLNEGAVLVFCGNSDPSWSATERGS
jgi:hypothetical protein